VRVQVGEDIDAAPSEVFRFVATDHFQNHPRWDPAVREMTPLAPGPMARGAVARLVRSDGGRTVHGVVRVTEYEPDHDFAATAEFGPFRLDQRAHFSGNANGGTHLTLEIDNHARGPARLLLPLLRPRFTRTMRQSLRSIKRDVEDQRHS